MYKNSLIINVNHVNTYKSAVFDKFEEKTLLDKILIDL